MRISDWSSDVCSSDLSLAVSGTKSLPRAIREGENPLSNAEHPAASGLRQGSTVPPILPPSPLRFAPLRRQQNRHPHRPLRGRFAVLAPARPPPAIGRAHV